MRCSKCNRVFENETGKCPFCSTPPRLAKRQKQRAEDSSWAVFPHMVDICPDCGVEVRGTVIHSSGENADVLSRGLVQPITKDAFLPDPHSCKKRQGLSKA